MFKKSFILSGGYIANTVVSGVFGIYVTRILGPEEKGVLAIALGSCGLMSALFSFGVPYSAAYYIRAHPGSQSFILSQTNRVMIVCALLSLSLIVMSKDAFSSLFLGGKAIDAFMTALLVGMVIVGAGNNIVGATLVAQGDSNGYAMSINAGTVINVVSTLLLLSLFHNRLHAIILGTLVGTICATFIMRNRFRLFAKEDTGLPHAVMARTFYKYGVQAQAGALGALLFKRVDIYLISYFINTNAVGLYSVGVSLRDIAMIASRSFAGLAGGEMADPVNQSNGTAKFILKKGIAFNMVVSFLIFIAAFFVFPYFIPVAYGESFRESINLSIIIMASLLPLSVSLLIGKAIQSKGRPLLQSVNSVISAVICTVVVWQFTKYYGILGAALATVVDSTILLLFSGIFLYLSDLRKNNRKEDGKIESV